MKIFENTKRLKRWEWRMAVCGSLSKVLEVLQAPWRTSVLDLLVIDGSDIFFFQGYIKKRSAVCATYTTMVLFGRHVKRHMSPDASSRVGKLFGSGYWSSLYRYVYSTHLYTYILYVYLYIYICIGRYIHMIGDVCVWLCVCVFSSNPAFLLAKCRIHSCWNQCNSIAFVWRFVFPCIRASCWTFFSCQVRIILNKQVMIVFDLMIV